MLPEDNDNSSCQDYSILPGQLQATIYHKKAKPSFFLHPYRCHSSHYDSFPVSILPSISIDFSLNGMQMYRVSEDVEKHICP
jgi:hypothetical protein